MPLFFQGKKGREFFQGKKGRENTLSQCLSTRRYFAKDTKKNVILKLELNVSPNKIINILESPKIIIIIIIIIIIT